MSIAYTASLPLRAALHCCVAAFDRGCGAESSSAHEAEARSGAPGALGVEG
jgi:hypothetical protein